MKLFICQHGNDISAKVNSTNVSLQQWLKDTYGNDVDIGYVSDRHAFVVINNERYDYINSETLLTGNIKAYVPVYCDSQNNITIISGCITYIENTQYNIDVYKRWTDVQPLEQDEVSGSCNVYYNKTLIGVLINIKE